MRKDRGTRIAEREGPVVAPATDARMVPDRTAVLERSSPERVPPREARAGSSLRRNSLIAAAAVVLLIIAFLGMRKGTKVTAPLTTQEPAVHMEQNLKQKSEEAAKAPLVLSIPRSMPQSEATVYVVVKGDTLWSIAQRFTGDPLNYPRVARDNSIATPDLIFPGQKIHLKRE